METHTIDEQYSTKRISNKENKKKKKKKKT